MESDAGGFASGGNRSPDEKQALNSTILEYYKKFGRKRDLEQYFSLNTAQSEVKDVSSLFWRRMKSQDSSDSGEKSKDTSLEVCRIQIKCSTDRDPASSQDDSRTKSDSESPPIITEEAPKALDASRDSNDESVKSDDDNKSVRSDDNNSQKSIDAVLDTSANKALSPSSSITSQRKLEWDSLADVGYANESEKRTSASSLSTLERLALKQQYSNNDTHENNLLGLPTAHSTPVDEVDMKSKSKRGSKTTKIYRKDVELVEVNMPQSSDVNPQSINVNLTKHISFNVDKAGGVSFGDVKKDYTVSPETKSIDTKVPSQETVDKEIQTSLIITKDKSSSSGEIPNIPLYGQSVPVLINLNNLKKRNRRKRVTASKKKFRVKKKINDKENEPILEKSVEQVSEAESFEYMPGHIYNQNKMNEEPTRPSQPVGNKSSLESSGAVTTDSSKGSKHSFTKDLENSIKLLKTALNKRYDDKELKQKLVKEVVQRLLKSNYRDDESSTDFLSGLSFSNKKIGLSEGNTTTSTSDANNTMEKLKLPRPKKSILRGEKFDSNDIASTSQSAPNLPAVSNSENPVSSNLAKVLKTPNSSSDASSKEKTSSDPAFVKTSSEELYQLYLNAVRREEAYKRHLRDKEQFLRQKLVASDTCFKRSATIAEPSVQLDVKSKIKLKELMKDLTRNNYDDGSGDASKLEGGFSSSLALRQNEAKSQRSHSVFTLSSSGNSDQNRKKKSEMKDVPQPGQSKEGKHYCCCPQHFGNPVGVTNSSVQVSLENEDQGTSQQSENAGIGPPCPAKCAQPVTHIVSDANTGDIKYLCLCNNRVTEIPSLSDNFLIYKCSRLSNKGLCCNVPSLPTANASIGEDFPVGEKPSKCSQTCLKLDTKVKENVCVHEAVRVIQTDISINPQISDPSLSDIKITSSGDCVQLVCEQFRQVSKSSINTDTNVEQNDVKVGESEINNQPSTSNINLNRGQTIEVKTSAHSITDVVKIHPDKGLQKSESNQQKIVPTQGTNMMLRVSVGSNPIRNVEVLETKGFRKPVQEVASFTSINIQDFEKLLDQDDLYENNPHEREKYDNAIVTENFDTREIATSLAEQFSIGVQSENKPLFSQEQEHRTADTIFAKQCNLFDQGPSTTNQQKPIPLLRTSTYSEQRHDICKQFYDDYYEQELDSGVNTYPKKRESGSPCPCPPPTECENLCGENAECRGLPDHPGKKVDTSCGPGRSKKTEIVSSSSLNNQCPCPEPNECGNICGIDAECRFRPAECVKKDTGSGPQEEINLESELRDVRRPCPCPAPAECGNVCEETAECWKTMRCGSTETPRKIESPKKTPQQSPRKTLNRRETVDSKPAPIPRKKSPCACPASAKCGGYCKKDAPCRNQFSALSDCYESPSTSRKGSPPRSRGSPRKSPVRNECFIVSEVKKSSPRRKSPCGCPPSAKCGGFCGKNAPCRDRDVVMRSGSPSQGSDSDYPDFEKLKDYLRTQSFPQRKPKSDKLRSPSLPSDLIRLGKTNMMALENDALENEQAIISIEEHSEPGSSKIQSTDSNDLIMNVIRDITNRYSKEDLGKNLKKRCFKEIVSILNYLLDTEETTDSDTMRGLRNMVANKKSTSDIDSRLDVKKCSDKPKLKASSSTSRGMCTDKNETGSSKEKHGDCVPVTKSTCDKGVQLSAKKSKLPKCCTESSDIITSSDHPRTSSDHARTSSDSVTCKVLNKIRKECEKYHRKCCKRQNSPKRCQCSSTTSMSCDQCKHIIVCQCQALSANCDQCKRIHYCQCRPHKTCKGYRPRTACEKLKKKCVAYNLIIQTSESMVSEECQFEKGRPLKNIIVKVPSRKQSQCNVPFKEMECDIGKQCSPRGDSRHRSKSLPNDSLSSADDYVKGTTTYTVKDYLERNRPDFIEQSGNRQKCLKMISETRANNRAAQRELLSMQVQLEPALRGLSDSDLRELARQLGFTFRQKKDPRKLISEREMKKHSERIYKKLPEVVQKKEELKKENIKKTNLLMANIFKKNLQRKTLQGSVNLSNYSTVIKF